MKIFMTLLIASILLQQAAHAATVLTIRGEDFHINSRPTYAGRSGKGHRIEGLLLNTRMVQATCDDLNPGTATRCAYPDTGKWHAERSVRASDFLLIHGNGVTDPNRITEMVKQARAVPGYRPMPVLFNEDDHEDFDKPLNNFTAALAEHVSWGWFDYRRKGEALEEGYQSPPVNWGISSDRKRAFFQFCAEITGSTQP